MLVCSMITHIIDVFIMNRYDFIYQVWLVKYLWNYVQFRNMIFENFLDDLS